MAKGNLASKIAQGKKHFGRVNDMYSYAFAGKKVAVKKKVNANIHLKDL